MRKILLLFITLLSLQYFYTVDAQDTITDRYDVSLLTCGPGTSEAYQAFGHTAIRVIDKKLNSDVVYNYGVFNFHDPDFYLKFTQGKLLYYLEKEPFYWFLQNYQEQNRWVRQQDLDISIEAETALVNALELNSLPENKYYKYDFLFNNCSTQQRDLLLKSLGASVNFDRYQAPVETFRDMIDRYMAYDEYTDLGIDLLLGLPCDATASNQERMFLPDELMTAIDSATINGKPLVKNSRMLFTATPTPSGFKLGPAFFVWIIFFILILQQVRGKRVTQARGIGFTYFFITGTIGFVLLFMWFGTDHLCTKWNLNLLWAFPLHLPLSFFLLKKDIPKWVKSYFYFFRIFFLLMIIFWAFRLQDFHKTIFPILLIGIWSISKFYPIPKVKEQPE